MSDDQYEYESGPAEPPTESITCVDCGGRCHLLTHPPEDGLWLAGDVVAYRCSDCLDRWDLVLMPLGEYLHNLLRRVNRYLVQVSLSLLYDTFHLKRSARFEIPHS